MKDTTKKSHLLRGQLYGVAMLYDMSGGVRKGMGAGLVLIPIKVSFRM